MQTYGATLKHDTNFRWWKYLDKTEYIKSLDRATLFDMYMNYFIIQSALKYDFVYDDKVKHLWKDNKIKDFEDMTVEDFCDNYHLMRPNEC